MKKKLFYPKGQPHGTVILNAHGTPEKEFILLAEAFHLTGKEVVSALRQDQNFGLDGDPYKDFRAYPIVFLYRHALELYMKAAIRACAPVLSLHGKGTINLEQLNRTHSLDKLRKDLERVFVAFKWSWDMDRPHFKTLEDFRKVINELHSVDSGSYAFRYPVDTEGRPSLDLHFRFTLFDLCDILDELFPFFDGVATRAYEELKSMSEARQYELDNSAYEPE